MRISVTSAVIAAYYVVLYQWVSELMVGQRDVGKHPSPSQSMNAESENYLMYKEGARVHMLDPSLSLWREPLSSKLNVIY